MWNDYEGNDTVNDTVKDGTTLHLPDSASESQLLGYDTTNVMHQHPSMRVESWADKYELTVDAPFNAPQIKLD